MSEAENSGEPRLAAAQPRCGTPIRRTVGAILRSPLRGKLRRVYLTTFRPGYVREQIEKRKGECRQCGSCCRLVILCPYLTPEALCRTYSHRCDSCTTFPIDKRDLRDVGPHCGYHF